jgi:hypothetical protein
MARFIGGDWRERAGSGWKNLLHCHLTFNSRYLFFYLVPSCGIIMSLAVNFTLYF